MNSKSILLVENIEESIYLIRGQRVMTDRDLACLYEVKTKDLNRAVERNIERLPEDFTFFLDAEEWNFLRGQIYNSKKGSGGKQRPPRVFTEYGAYAAAFVLRSPRAQTMSIEVIRAFIHMRKALSFNEGLAKEAKELKSFVLKHSHKTDQEFRRVWNAIEKISAPPAEHERIGFRLD